MFHLISFNFNIFQFKIVNSVINAKRFTRDMGMAMALSVGGSGLIAGLLDAVLWRLIVRLVTFDQSIWRPPLNSSNST